MTRPPPTPRQIDRAIDAVAALVLLSVGFALAALLWRVAVGPSAHVAAAAPAPARPPTDVAPLIALAPFGQAGSAAAAPT